MALPTTPAALLSQVVSAPAATAAGLLVGLVFGYLLKRHRDKASDPFSGMP